ncbi:hypothetical protein E8L90_05405 [Brevibacillus antibioticus]|uniref:Uncharacterized protein n=1 Tax=Brevibacillus antibioticus TaxID=2570228 RepID=A0A4U2Y398_9BACL|nr:hypothetical protein [Brevibacillus antibioticus]TKI54928.1 hypothetical protein E8L90_05405 [Brevibacillus antibioticus]
MLIDKQVVVIKDDGGTLPKGHHSQVFITKDHSGNDIEWFKDAAGVELEVRLFIRNGTIMYL